MSGQAPDVVAAAVPDTCPRCGGGFACGMAGSGPCPCTTVSLPAAVLADLRGRFTGCLCLRCLQALAAGDHRQAADLRPGV